uniref:Uncharacterized protein n=1 Tax=Timema douglasi TaxID=61478 RepID=A0A7R8VSI2_TIMDO|nr:unnamed protein product [Timema douglasi]
MLALTYIILSRRLCVPIHACAVQFADGAKTVKLNMTSAFANYATEAASAIYGFRDPSVLVGVEGYFGQL